MFLSNINQRQIYIPQLPTDGKCVFSILASVTVHSQMHKALSQKRHPWVYSGKVVKRRPGLDLYRRLVPVDI